MTDPTELQSLLRQIGSRPDVDQVDVESSAGGGYRAWANTLDSDGKPLQRIVHGPSPEEALLHLLAAFNATDRAAAEKPAANNDRLSARRTSL